jgi:predicted site-specific integrase-resolvase
VSERAYLTSKEVADRWRLSDQTLANWRHAGKGPPYIRVGARVLYPAEAIQAFEKLSPNWLAADNIQSEPQST